MVIPSKSSLTGKTLTRVVVALGLVGACTVVDKGDYTFVDDPDAKGGEAGGGTGGAQGGSDNGGSSGSSGSSGTSGGAGEGGDGDTGGTSGASGASGMGGTSGDAGASGSGGSGDGGPCDPNPCEHGTCSELGQDYDCVCELGWEGSRCSVNIDDCDPNPCANGIACQDLVNDFKCDCPGELTGKICDIPRFETMALPNGGQGTVARAVNADGSIVVGWFFDMSSHYRPFQWTRLRGTQPMPIGSLPFGANYYPASASSDGNNWVGYYEGVTPPALPFRGNNGGAMQLGLPTTASGGFARAISGDGTRVVGNFTEMGARVVAVHWPDQAATAVPLPNPFGGTAYASADAITRDGMFVAGVVKDTTGTPYLAFWPPPGVTPPQPLRIPNAMEAQVNGMSANGQVGVGTYMGTATSGYAFAYDLNGVTSIAPVMGASIPVRSAAWDVSDDGLLVVGEATTGPSGMEEPRAHIWQDARTPELLAEVMNQLRIPLPQGFRLVRAYGVSANNRVIVGEGLNINGQQEGFILRLP